ncbi:AraC family transcriptional regulator [Paenibacillaceae bacterium]|nr:AraC family transcriptional regulator [Paenibacillaceae bacterium]
MTAFPQRAHKARRNMEQTAAYMQQHLHENITREQLAAMAGLNPEHYSRLFRKYMGHSPTDYLNGLRMDRAKYLLRETRETVRAVAKQAGFPDPYYFSRRFSRLVGMSPSQYRMRPHLRLAALEYYGHCVALGLQPSAVAMSPNSKCLPPLGREIADVAISPDTAVPSGEAVHPNQPERCYDLEQLARSRPDMIITARKEQASSLSDIAPTVIIEMTDDPIYEQLPAIGKLANRASAAAHWIACFERDAAAFRRQLAVHAAGQTIAVLRIRGEILQIYGNQIMGYPLYNALRLHPPYKLYQQLVVNRHHHSSVITADELPNYNADHLFVVLQPDEPSRQALERLQAMPCWQQYMAVVSGNVHYVDMRRWLAFDPLSIASQMAEAVELIVASKA